MSKIFQLYAGIVMLLFAHVGHAQAGTLESYSGSTMGSSTEKHGSTPGVEPKSSAPASERSAPPSSPTIHPVTLFVAVAAMGQVSAEGAKQQPRGPMRLTYGENKNASTLEIEAVKKAQNEPETYMDTRGGARVIPEEGIRVIYEGPDKQDAAEFMLEPAGGNNYLFKTTRLNIDGALRSPGDQYEVKNLNIEARYKVDANFARALQIVTVPKGSFLNGATTPLEEAKRMQLSADTYFVVATAQLAEAGLLPSDWKTEPWNKITFKYSLDTGGTDLRRIVANKDTIIFPENLKPGGLKLDIQKTPTSDYAGLRVSSFYDIDNAWHALGERYTVGLTSRPDVIALHRLVTLDPNNSVRVNFQTPKVEMWIWPGQVDARGTFKTAEEGSLKALADSVRDKTTPAVRATLENGAVFWVADGMKYNLILRGGTFETNAIERAISFPPAGIPGAGRSTGPASNSSGMLFRYHEWPATFKGYTNDGFPGTIFNFLSLTEEKIKRVQG